MDRGGVHPDLLDGAMPHFPNPPIEPITGRSPYIVVPMVPGTITPGYTPDEPVDAVDGQTLRPMVGCYGSRTVSDGR